jgi:hypothetical protein
MLLFAFCALSVLGCESATVHGNFFDHTLITP